MEGPAISLATSELRGWVLAVLQRYGMFAVDAECLLARLLEAEHRGRREQGLRALGDIVSALDMGDIDPRARVLKSLDLPAVAILDGSTGVGQVAATRAMELAIEKATMAGIALVVIRNSQPCDDVRSIAELAAQANCIGYCTTNSGKARHAAAHSANWLSQHPAAWSFPAESSAWTTGHAVSQELLTSAEAGPLALAQGLLSLSLTAGLTAARLPEVKKKASPYGAGAEHACLAIHLPSFKVQEHWQADMQTCLSRGGAAFQQVTFTETPETLEAGPELLAVLNEVATQSRVALPASFTL